MRFSTRKKAI